MKEKAEDRISVPILIVAFNRPEVTEIVFNKVREAKPLKLYVVVDGARNSKVGEEDLVNKVRQIVQNVDWECETQYRFQEINKGAEVTVSSAISWVLEKEEYVIILEDDIVAPMAFLRFAEEMLIRYKEDDRIVTVTGSNFTPLPVPNDTDYFFAKYGHSWGWATWRRAWKGFDLDVSIPDEHLTTEFLTTITSSKAELLYYKKLFTAIQKSGIGNSTWDVVGLYYFRINNKLSIIPRVNLTSNIGIFGLHARGKSEHHFRPVDDNFVVKKHPAKVDYFLEYDQHHFKTYIHKHRIKPLYERAFKKVLKFFGAQ